MRCRADLPAQVPQLNGDRAARDLAHVEAHGGDHVLMEGARGNHVDQRRFARILQAYQRQLHLLLEEQAAPCTQGLSASSAVNDANTTEQQVCPTGPGQH